MKRSAILFMPILLMLASCGTPAQYSQQRFPDSIYLSPQETEEVRRLYTEEEFARMAAIKRASERQRDTLVLDLDDPWDLAWYNRYNRFHYYSPYLPSWAWGSMGTRFSYWWTPRYYYPGGWIDPWYDWYWDYPSYGWYGGLYDYMYAYDPWYYRYYGYYSPWYYDRWYGAGYGWYGYGYGYGPGWYGRPGHAHAGFDNYAGRVYTPRYTTESGGSRVSRPGSGANYRYGSSNTRSHSGGGRR